MELSKDRKSVTVKMADTGKFQSEEHFWALYMLLSNEKEGVPYSFRQLGEGVYLVQPFE